MRSLILAAGLALALILTVLTSQTPQPAGPDTGPPEFSAARAMTDVRLLAAAPRPLGSPGHEAAKDHLLARLRDRDMVMQESTQSGPLSEAAERRWRAEGGQGAAPPLANLIGVREGRRPELPAVLLMAHYDSVPGSPGAGDDAAGVAGVLEAARATRQRGRPERTLVVLLTDGEELGLEGARLFFERHPLRDRIGAVVNLEARGGGGQAVVLETGEGGAETVRLLARTGTAASAGLVANSLAAYAYGLTPNGTDFTLARDRGLAGINLTFFGRAGQYHAPSATADALDQGSLQQIGTQALEMTDALLWSRDLPKAGEDRVYADLFGRVLLHHAPGFGWVLWGLAAALGAVAAWRARRLAGLSAGQVGRGMLDGVWLLAAAVVACLAMRGLAVQGTQAGYYDLLARVRGIEAACALASAGVVLAVMAGRGAGGGRWAAGAAGLLALVALAGGAPVLLTVVAGGLAAGSGRARSVWGGWLGLLALVLLLGAAAQGAAPQAAWPLVWIGLLAAGMAAAASLADPALLKVRTLTALSLVAAVGAAWLMGLAHLLFLGVGADLPMVLAPVALLIALLFRPLSPERGRAGAVLTLAGVLLLAGAGTALASRDVETSRVERAP